MIVCYTDAKKYKETTKRKSILCWRIETQDREIVSNQGTLCVCVHMCDFPHGPLWVSLSAVTFTKSKEMQISSFIWAYYNCTHSDL